MKVDVPVYVKQKCGPRARSAYLSSLRGNTQRVRGSAELSGKIDIPGVTVSDTGPVYRTDIAMVYARIECDANLIKDLAAHESLVSFEIEEMWPV